MRLESGMALAKGVRGLGDAPIEDCRGSCLIALKTVPLVLWVGRCSVDGGGGGTGIAGGLSSRACPNMLVLPCGGVGIIK